VVDIEARLIGFSIGWSLELVVEENRDHMVGRVDAFLGRAFQRVGVDAFLSPNFNLPFSQTLIP
jgi:hypothetical protein